MIVYVVERDIGKGKYVLGVYSSLDNAKNACPLDVFTELIEYYGFGIPRQWTNRLQWNDAAVITELELDG